MTTRNARTVADTVGAMQAITVPEPGGPEISTRLFAGATLAMVVRSAWAAADRPMRPVGAATWARSRRFSRFSAEASSAL